MLPITKIHNPICPYCLNVSEYVDSSVIYGRSYGMIYLCKPCDAYCGVHAGSDVPLGSLANAVTRQARKEAHALFDPLWQRKMEKGYTKNAAREASYIWLAKEMRIHRDECHIGSFTAEQCEQVIKICSSLLKPDNDWARYAAVQNRRYP